MQLAAVHENPTSLAFNSVGSMLRQFSDKIEKVRRFLEENHPVSDCGFQILECKASCHVDVVQGVAVGLVFGHETLLCNLVCWPFIFLGLRGPNGN